MNSSVPALIFLLCVWFTILGAFASEVSSAYSVVVNRKERSMQVESKSEGLILKTPVGIGAGGLRKKRSMQDMVTPTGTFTADIVLASEPGLCAIDPALLRRYKGQPEYERYLSSERGLAELFDNMNKLDFDGDGKPDRAYGDGYIGLNSSEAVTGPKLSKFKGIIYWYSIAIHGTAEEKNKIGKACSGGCIEIPSGPLKKLLSKKIASPGLSVTIHD